MNPGYVRRHVAGTAKDAARTDSLWRLTRSFRVHVLLATYVNVKARMENIFYLLVGENALHGWVSYLLVTWEVLSSIQSAT